VGKYSTILCEERELLVVCTYAGVPYDDKRFVETFSTTVLHLVCKQSFGRPKQSSEWTPASKNSRNFVEMYVHTNPILHKKPSASLKVTFQFLEEIFQYVAKLPCILCFKEHSKW